MTQPLSTDAGFLAIARFFRSLASASSELARELERSATSGQHNRSLSNLNLGSLQRSVAEAIETLNMTLDDSVSPREIARHLGREDEPNIRTALGRLEELGVAERVPDVTPQRWRLTIPYRI